MKNESVRSKFAHVIARVKMRNTYATNKREPFYALAGRYLPESEEAIVVDVGSGYGYFADYLELREKYNNVYLLDADSEAVDRVKDTVLYEAPARMPFDDSSVYFLHCSHLVEHLKLEDVQRFLKEIDRVLISGGVLVISAPLLQYRFYNNLAHVQPYGPEGFVNYMCGTSEGGTKKTIAGADKGVVSEDYTVENLTYRYIRHLDDREWGSKYLWISVAMELVKKAIRTLGFAKYTKNGYTLVLRKQR